MDGYGGRRCTKTGRNEPVNAAKRTGEGCCGLRRTRTGRDGRTGTGLEMHRSSEADDGWLWRASLHENRQKWACGCSEADRRGMLWASQNGDKQRRTDGNRTRDAQEQRSGRWMAMVGVAARKQAEMNL